MRTIFTALGLVLTSGAASAYDIKTNTPVLKLDAIHEMMTRAAVLCADRSMSVNATQMPRDCWDASINTHAATISANDLTPLERAVRWSDDPTRQGSGFSYPKLGLSLKVGCPSQVAAVKGIDSAGLLCSSHYGRMQFLHAMKGIDDPSSEQTRQRILAWAEFAYQVASGDEALMAQSVCAAAASRAGLADALAFDDPSKCQQRPKAFGSGTYPPYTVRTLFTLKCKKPLSSKKCVEIANGREEAMLASTGSLLHLIQDSYSQAHASRSTATKIEEKGPFETKIVCRLPTQFFNYSNQTKDVHGAADHQANRDSSCISDGASDDPVTASAALLWHLRTKQSPQAFAAYLAKTVIGDRPLTD